MDLASCFARTENNRNYILMKNPANKVTNLFFLMLLVTKGAELDTGFEQRKNNLFLIKRYSEELSFV